MEKKISSRTMKICLTGLMAAMCFVGFAFLKIDISAGFGKTAIHFGNAFCVLAALLLGGVYGGVAGAIGMGLADLVSGYATSAPMTVVLKLIMGLLAGFLFKAFKKLRLNDFLSSLFASIITMAANIVLDPTLRFLFNKFVYGATTEAASILAKISSISTAINSLTTVIIVVILFNALNKVVKKYI